MLPLMDFLGPWMNCCWTSGWISKLPRVWGKRPSSKRHLGGKKGPKGGHDASYEKSIVQHWKKYVFQCPCVMNLPDSPKFQSSGPLWTHEHYREAACSWSPSEGDQQDGYLAKKSQQIRRCRVGMSHPVMTVFIAMEFMKVAQ